MHTSIILLLTTLSNIIMHWQGSKRNKRNDSSMLFHVSRKSSGMSPTVLVCQKHCTTTLEYLIWFVTCDFNSTQHWYYDSSTNAKVYCFSCVSSDSYVEKATGLWQIDRQTDRQNNLGWAGQYHQVPPGKLAHMARSHPMHLGWRNFFLLSSSPSMLCVWTIVQDLVG